MESIASSLKLRHCWRYCSLTNPYDKPPWLRHDAFRATFICAVYSITTSYSRRSRCSTVSIIYVYAYVLSTSSCSAVIVNPSSNCRSLHGNSNNNHNKQTPIKPSRSYLKEKLKMIHQGEDVQYSQ